MITDLLLNRFDASLKSDGYFKGSLAVGSRATARNTALVMNSLAFLSKVCLYLRYLY